MESSLTFPFIRAPFTKCPNCGKDTYGICTIGDKSYTRRCASCYFPKGGERFLLPELSKKIIYLDQFVISNIAKYLDPKSKSHDKINHNPFWGELFEQIDSLCKMQLIVCPDSVFHKFESIATSYPEQLKRIYELFSGGITFHNYEDIKINQLYDQFLIWFHGTNRHPTNINSIVHGNINAWQDWFIISMNSSVSQELVDELRHNRDIVCSNYEEVFKRWITEEDKSFEDWFNEESEGAARSILQLHVQYLENFSKTLLGKPLTLEDLLPSYATRIIMAMEDKIKEKGITNPVEMHNKVMGFLKSKEFNDTPYVKIGSAIYAAMANRAAHHGRRKPPGRGFYNDVLMLSTFLPYCDAMFIDDECRSLLNEREVKNTLNLSTKLFSISNKEEFLKYLNQIKSTASQEHLNALKEVYGDEYRKPFTEIFRA